MKKADKTKNKQLYYLEYIILEARIAEKTNYFKERKDHGNKKLFLESQLEGKKYMLRHVNLTQR